MFTKLCPDTSEIHNNKKLYGTYSMYTQIEIIKVLKHNKITKPLKS